MAVEGNAHDRARVVRRYLSALDASKTGRTPAKTAETLQFRMHQIDIDLLSADPVARLHLTQERIDLHAEYLRLTTGAEQLAELERAFVRVARGYGDRHDISYSAWRQIGVDAQVLAKAGIKPNKPARPAAKAGPAGHVAEAPPATAEPPVVAEPEPEPVAAEPTPAAAEPTPAAAEPAAQPEPAKKAPAKKLKTVAKKAPAATKKSTAAKNGAKAAVKKTAAEQPPAEAHLLS